MRATGLLYGRPARPDDARENHCREDQEGSFRLSSTQISLAEIYKRTLERLRPDALVRDWIEARDGDTGFAVPRERFAVKVEKGSKLWLLGAGKDAVGMVCGAWAKLASQVAGGLVVCPEDVEISKEFPNVIRVMRATHPLPSEASVAAAKAMMALAEKIPPSDHVLFFLSGGASSLLCLPRDGVSLEEKIKTTEALIKSGAAISEINEKRKALSKIKGGGIARALKAQATVFVFSDVAGNGFESIGSAPMLDEGKNFRHVLVADGRLLARTAKSVAESFFENVEVDFEPVVDRVEVVAGAYAEWVRHHVKKGAPKVWIRFGEPVVRVTGSGLGGRSQHLSVLIARELTNISGWNFLAAGSDGRDGPTNAAGAIVDGESWKKMGAAGSLAIQNFDSYKILQKAGALVALDSENRVNLQDLHILRIY